jgi:hypothetical protein
VDLEQMYNNSAMVHDSFLSYVNQTQDDSEQRKFQQLAQEQQSISDRLKPNQNEQP